MGMTTALIYPPSSYAGAAELIEVAKSAAKAGGIYASHIRGEGKEVVTSVEEAIEIGEKAGLPVEIFHLMAYCMGTLAVRRRVDDARRRGVDVAADLLRLHRQAGSASRRRFRRGRTRAVVRSC